MRAADLCRDDAARRAAVRAGALNGLDYVEVDDADRHRLTVVFLRKLGDVREQLTAESFRLCGGVRVRDPVVVGVEVCEHADPETDDCAVLTVEPIGDFSTYTLRVVGDDGGAHPAFDPCYSSLEVDFQAMCPSPLDCVTVQDCPEPAGDVPPIDYLAKDYSSFRQLLLDRLALLVPGWDERHEPDLMVTLVELMAYEGDRLSYLQDAVATEAYLDTARQRISVRRHARLVDYRLHEGCNARTWVFVETSQDTGWLSADELFFATALPTIAADGRVLSATGALARVPPEAYEVFEPMALPAGPPDAGALARRLRAGEDPAAALVRDRLRPKVRDALLAWDGEGDPPAGLDHELMRELDRLAHEQALHVATPFADHLRRGEARRLLRRPLRGADLVALNHVLLQGAFAQELAPPSGVRFLAAHNRIVLHTWGARDCCLARGATAATLVDDGLQLVAGDWLLLEEVRDPATGLAEDAEPMHRHVVRLTGARRAHDPVLDVALLEVEWALEDALPFALCLSAQGPAPDCAWIDEVSVARGNVVLTDHGRRRRAELDAVEVGTVDAPCDGCRPEQELVAAPYRPVLAGLDLTYAEPLPRGATAAACLVRDPRAALPAIALTQVALAPPRLDDPDPLARYRNPLGLTAFDPEDLVAPAALAARLRAPDGDAVATVLLGLCDETTRGLLDQGDEDSEALIAGLLRALDSALDDDHLATRDGFSPADLDDATQALAAQPDLPLDLRRTLRRWILEQVLDAALGPAPHLVASWAPRLDLLASGAEDRDFVVEMTDDRHATLRFGDDDLGRRPEPVTRFRADHRIGSGPPGNVGAEAIAHVVLRSGTLDGVTLRPRNPLPATGGTVPETLDDARRLAPGAIRRDLQRAVTGEDYATLAARDFAARLQGADAELVWTGSWHEAYVTLDPRGRESLPAGLREAVQARLERYRRIGHGLRVAGARYVPLDIRMDVCVEALHLQAHVLHALQDVIAAAFAPDNERFRSGVDVSDLVAVAQQVEGVVWSAVTRLQRTGEGDRGELAAGTLAIGPLEIPRVDSTPGFPELGSIGFDLRGGR